MQFYAQLKACTFQNVGPFHWLTPMVWCHWIIGLSPLKQSKWTEFTPTEHSQGEYQRSENSFYSALLKKIKFSSKRIYLEKGKWIWQEFDIAEGMHRWMKLQARSKERRDLCCVQRKGQKKNSRSGWAALKWTKQLFIQGRDGQVRQVGNNNHRAICCPGTLHPQGMKQILSSRSSSSVAVTSLSSKQHLNRALKLAQFLQKLLN